MIGDRIRGLRTSHRLSQTELSKLLHVSQQTITKMMLYLKKSKINCLGVIWGSKLIFSFFNYPQMP